MALSLRTQLIGAFLLIAVVTAGLGALVIQQTSIARLADEVAQRERQFFATQLAEFYRQNNSWENVRPTVNRLLTGGNPLQPGQAPSPPGAGANSGPGAAPAAPPALFGLPAVIDRDRVVVLPIAEFPSGMTVPPDVLARLATPIVLDGQRVGWVLTVQGDAHSLRQQGVFVEITYRALLAGSVGGIATALLIGLILAHGLTAPLRKLTVAARRMAQGDLEQSVPVTSGDEIGRLAATFNQMSQELTMQTRLRRQMAADIAHDLRTPLTAIAGYVEAMEEGDLEPTTARLHLVSTEVQRLQDMVSDLRVLSQADAGELRLNLQNLSAAALVERAAEAHRHRAARRGIELVIDAPAGGVQVRVDEARMARVFDNLVDNAVEHTPEGGRIVLSVAATPRDVAFSVRDSGQGVEAEKLPHLFDRFYRADEARGADRHSGLGLAIVRALVEAHGGTVRAESQLGDWTEMVATLPAAELN
jgi:signal transduction histidine kinase